MGIFADYFGGNSYLNLAESETKAARRPKTTNNNSTNRKDVKETIRELYESDWFTFSSVNVSSTLFSKPDYTIVSKQDDGDKIWHEFFRGMRQYGNTASLKRLRADIKRDAVAYGAGYLEFIPSEDGSEILDLKRVDSSRMRKAKDGKQNLILDASGKSIGYILALGPTADLRGKGDPIPQEYTDTIQIHTGDIFLLPGRIAEFPLYRLGNNEEAMGVVEPSIQQTKRRQKIEDAQVNAIYIRGTAPLFALVGDPTHEPNPQMLEDAADALSEMRHSSVASFPYHTIPQALDAKVDDISTKIMDYLMSAEAGAGNVPLPFVTGAGEETNRSTLKTQREMFEINIQEKIECFDEDWNLKVMDFISEYNGFPEAKIISEELRLESKDETASRMATWVGIQALSPEEVRTTALRLEKIQPDEESYKKFRAESKEQNTTVVNNNQADEKKKQTKNEKDSEKSEN